MDDIEDTRYMVDAKGKRKYVKVKRIHHIASAHFEVEFWLDLIPLAVRTTIRRTDGRSFCHTDARTESLSISEMCELTVLLIKARKKLMKYHLMMLLRLVPM